MPLIMVREVGRMNEAEGGGRKQFTLFALAGGGLDDFRGIPFAEIDLAALLFEPALQQIYLRRLIDAN